MNAGQSNNTEQATAQSLWLLRPREDADRWGDNYDMVYGYVVAATSDDEARRTIVDGSWEMGPGDEGDEAWLDPKHSTCELIARVSKYEKPTVVLRDFLAG